MDNANRGISSMAKEKPAFVRLQVTVAEKLSEAKEKNSAYNICLSKMGIIYQQCR